MVNFQISVKISNFIKKYPFAFSKRESGHILSYYLNPWKNLYWTLISMVFPFFLYHMSFCNYTVAIIVESLVRKEAMWSKSVSRRLCHSEGQGAEEQGKAPRIRFFASSLAMRGLFLEFPDRYVTTITWLLQTLLRTPVQCENKSFASFGTQKWTYYFVWTPRKPCWWTLRHSVFFSKACQVASPNGYSGKFYPRQEMVFFL